MQKKPDSVYWQQVHAATVAEERQLIIKAFANFEKLSAAAEFLGVSESFLSRRHTALGIPLPSKRVDHRRNRDQVDPPESDS